MLNLSTPKCLQLNLNFCLKPWKCFHTEFISYPSWASLHKTNHFQDEFQQKDRAFRSEDDFEHLNLPLGRTKGGQVLTMCQLVATRFGRGWLAQHSLVDTPAPFLTRSGIKLCIEEDLNCYLRDYSQFCNPLQHSKIPLMELCWREERIVITQLSAYQVSSSSFPSSL